jgi:hypothetical protein
MSNSTASHIAICVTAYLIAIVAANLSVAAFGPAVAPINAFLFIGLDLVLRDRLHELWQGRQLWPRMLGLIATGSLLSYALSSAAGPIALASFVAFAGASLADAFVYHTLLHRPWMVRSNGSNLVGALVDSLLFPVLAFGGFPVTIMIILAQFVAKTLGGLVWSWLLGRARQPAGAVA